MNKNLVALFLLTVVLFANAIAGIIVYYNNKIVDLSSQISSLKTQIENVTSANLTSELTITGIPWPNTFLNGTMIPDYYPHGFNDFFINGSVTNDGGGVAFNAGLHVSAYTNNDTLAVNMTVPLVNGDWVFGTDATTNTFVLNYYKDYLGTLPLGYLKSGQTVTFDLSFFYEAHVFNWTLTPVWTNMP
jgi:hypothetical protein